MSFFYKKNEFFYKKNEFFYKKNEFFFTSDGMSHETRRERIAYPSGKPSRARRLGLILTGIDVIIFKIFSPKNSAKNWRF
jgi:hypothetical protein